ncbi:MAG: rhodanese-like domain-containing protein [Bacteroidota bacterium]
MKKQYKQIAAILAVIALVAYGIAQQSATGSAVITAKETYTQLQNDSSVFLLDVRTPQEHFDTRINNAPVIPVQELEQRIHELDALKDRTIIVYCRSGNRSGVATKLLREHGFNAKNMQGGIIKWKAEQLPTINGPKE